MKKKIAILGSTGSIGSTSLNIFSKNKKNFQLFFYQQTQITLLYVIKFKSIDLNFLL